MLKSVFALVLEFVVPLLIVWAMVRSRKPLWIRWAAGVTAYLAYVQVAHSWLHTRSWLVVTSLGDILLVFLVVVLTILRGGSSEEEMRALGMSLGEKIVRIGPMKLAWIEFALVPALILAAAHYTHRFVATRRERGDRVHRASDPPPALIAKGPTSTGSPRGRSPG